MRHIAVGVSVIALVLLVTGCENREKSAGTLLEKLKIDVEAGQAAQLNDFSLASNHFQDAVEVINQIEQKYVDTKAVQESNESLNGQSFSAIRVTADDLQILSKAESDPAVAASWMLKRDFNSVRFLLAVPHLVRSGNEDLIVPLLPQLAAALEESLRRRKDGADQMFPPPVFAVVEVFNQVKQFEKWTKLETDLDEKNLLTVDDKTQIKQAKSAIGGYETQLDGNLQAEISKNPVESLKETNRLFRLAETNEDLMELGLAGRRYAFLNQTSGISRSLAALNSIFKAYLSGQIQKDFVWEQYFEASSGVLRTYCEAVKEESRPLKVMPHLDRLLKENAEGHGLESVYGIVSVKLQIAQALFSCGRSSEAVSIIEPVLQDVFHLGADIFASYSVSEPAVRLLSSANRDDLVLDNFSSSASEVDLAVLAEYLKPKKDIQPKLQALMRSILREELLSATPK